MKEMITLEECPICRGAGMLMHEGGWSVQVECVDCSAHTVYVEYSTEEEKNGMLRMRRKSGDQESPGTA